MEKSKNNVSSFNDFLEEQLKDPELKAEYDALEPEFVIMEAIMKARIETGLTQKELSEKTGISQADISRLEHGTANPSIKTLQRIATALDRKLSIQFI
ncbi:MAG TPA: transcriptional regulator [Clostridiales bacterium]|nr:transcriptional regulator [Clostridiales bacterium]